MYLPRIFARLGVPEDRAASAVAQVSALLSAPRELYAQAETWCHTRELFLQLEQGIYMSRKVQCATRSLLARLLGNDGTVEVATGSETVRADTSVLSLTLEEGLSNARKYRRPGMPIALHAALEDGLAGAESTLHVRLTSVNRDGVPRLSEADCKRVFEPGYKAHSTTSASSDGKGLDTAAVAATAAHGKVWMTTHADGEEAVCTVFHVALPAVADDATVADTITPEDATGPSHHNVGAADPAVLIASAAAASTGASAAAVTNMKSHATQTDEAMQAEHLTIDETCLRFGQAHRRLRLCQVASDGLGQAIAENEAGGASNAVMQDWDNLAAACHRTAAAAAATAAAAAAVSAAINEPPVCIGLDDDEWMRNIHQTGARMRLDPSAIFGLS